MTKREVLTIFNQANGFLTPDEVQRQLRPPPDRRSFYSYLLRLARQGLLETGRPAAGVWRTAFPTEVASDCCTCNRPDRAPRLLMGELSLNSRQAMLKGVSRILAQ